MSRDALRDLVAPMSEQPVDLDDGEFRVDRERVVAAMLRASRRDRWGLPRALLIAAAAVALLVSGARVWQREAGSTSSPSLEVWVSKGSATQVHGAKQTDVAAGRTTHIAAAGDLETGADSQAQVRAADGLQIELRSQTSLALGQLQQTASQVTLLGGEIRCTVPRRAASRAFQVVTADVTVVDLGTVFTVTLDGPGRATRVWVEEGEVLIRQASGQMRLRAPDHWSSAGAGAAALSEEGRVTPAPHQPASAMKSDAKGVHSAANVGPARAAPSPTLEAEAQLLRDGLTAERQGRLSDSVAALTQLITRYPHSPLVPDAAAALARVRASAPQ
jgi:FecR protein